MVTVVNEPPGEYKVIKWHSVFHYNILDDHICGIENGIVFLCPTRDVIYEFFNKKPKRKLSSLRGKMTLQNEKEIDEQILNLRNEWERNI